jgi:NAD(P)-dependent dehydrogenase (short-subunit alcohol dehydrogenase family)
MPNQFVTGATGFIGRRLVENLLNRGGTVYALVRPESISKIDALRESLEHGDRLIPVEGDLGSPMLGVSSGEIEKLASEVDDFFHLAAVYDMTADEERNRIANVEGTRHAVELANALGARMHHVSSIAVAGDHKGNFREDMFDEGQPLTHPYHRTKFEAEKIVRTDSTVPWRVYRPAIVVGDSRTGEMDKIDGPYYFFKAIQKARGAIPAWIPLIGPEMGDTNVVPVDWVAASIDHIAYMDGMDGRAFHLANPKPQSSGDIINTFAKAAHAPQLAMRVDTGLLEALPKGTLSLAMQIPAMKGVRKAVLADLGIPDEVLGYVGLTAEFDTRDSEQALAGTGIEIPELDQYAWKLWDYWERHLDPDLYKDKSLEGAVSGRTVLITGASSGIGRAAALKVAESGGVPLLVARSMDKLEDLKREIEASGGSAYAYSADLTDFDSIDSLVERVLADHASVDVLVNNAGRSIRRSLALSYDRFHDFERTIQLNYLGTVRLIMGLLPGMRERRRGHIVNVSSIGVQTGPPRFSAYVASKAALDGFTRIAGSETISDQVTFTTIHMPLVRTPMIAPTKIYDSFPTISPEEAADLICEAIRSKPKNINTKLGTFGEVAYALAPKAVDQIMSAAYKVFPDSAASKGQSDPEEKASAEQIALAHLMRGIHW